MISGAWKDSGDVVDQIELNVRLTIVPRRGFMATVLSDSYGPPNTVKFEGSFGWSLLCDVDFAEAVLQMLQGDLDPVDEMYEIVDIVPSTGIDAPPTGE